jgi:hypothetical protein
MGLSAGLAGKATALLAASISPAFVLLKVSGVPLSENEYDKKYGDCERLQEMEERNADVRTEALKHAHNISPIKPI